MASVKYHQYHLILFILLYILYIIMTKYQYQYPWQMENVIISSVSADAKFVEPVLSFIAGWHGGASTNLWGRSCKILSFHGNKFFDLNFQYFYWFKLLLCQLSVKFQSQQILMLILHNLIFHSFGLFIWIFSTFARFESCLFELKQSTFIASFDARNYLMYFALHNFYPLL